MFLCLSLYSCPGASCRAEEKMTIGTGLLLTEWSLQAQAEKERIEKRGFALAAPYKNNGKFQQPKWFVADPDRSKFKAGEGIRWRYNHRCFSFCK